MKRKSYLKIIIGILSVIIFMKVLATVLFEPWIEKKLRTSLNEKDNSYQIKIKRASISLIKSRIELKNITINSKKSTGGKSDFHGEIAYVKFTGVNFLKALFKKDISISEIDISGSNIKGVTSTSHKTQVKLLVPLNISVGLIIIEKTNIMIGSTSSAQLFNLKEGNLKVYNLRVERKDTLSLSLIREFDFETKKLLTISSDSMYTYSACNLVYSSASKTISADSASVHPNYTNSDFTSRYKYQKTRIEVDFSEIFIHGFNVSEYFSDKSLTSSYIEVGKMEMKVFRDNRKEFQHIKIPTFQERIYSYKGVLNIDSIRLLNGNISYTEHAKGANEPGNLNFNKIHASIYKISNNTIYKTRSAFLKLSCDALLMEKGKIKVLLKAILFDPSNTFSVNGTLTGMEAKELNPFLEKNAFVYVTSGKIDGMKFSFTSDNSSSSGQMNLLYHGLNLTVKNKRSDDTTAFKERFISAIANSKILSSNPIPGENARTETIYYRRDPEKFLFSYCAKSILSGIKSSLLKKPARK